MQSEVRGGQLIRSGNIVWKMERQRHSASWGGTRHRPSPLSAYYKWNVRPRSGSLHTGPTAPRRGERRPRPLCLRCAP